MTLSNFIPMIWSARLLASLNDAHVFPALCNRDYEGEITGLGDTVKINSIGRVTIGSYTKNSNLSDPETLTDAQTTLLINNAKYFNFQVDDIDKAQTKPKVMDEAMRDAAWGLEEVVDTALAGEYTNAAAGNKIGSDASPKTFSSNPDPYGYLVDMGVKLTENNVSQVGRWVVVPPWYYGLLLKNSLFVAATPQGDNRLMNGIVGRAAGFDVYQSNNLTIGGTGTDVYRIMAGYQGTMSYAEQVRNVEAYRPEKRFADAVKGLLLYGYKTVRPSTMAVLFAQKPS